MSLISDIKKDARRTGTKMQSTEATRLEHILNNIFYLEKNIEQETKFVKQVMTRGLESQERVGLHASNMLESDKKLCMRSQVLSLVYRQLQGEQVDVGLMRIFEQGNAIHEKWQRLFIRAGYGSAYDMDRTRIAEKYKLSYTPDLDVYIPEFFSGRMIGEIKSVNTYTFFKMVKHASAWKQALFYSHLCIEELKAKGEWNGVDYTKCFVLSEDKNTQDFKIEVYDYDKTMIQKFIDRADAIIAGYEKLINEHKLIKKPKDADGLNGKRCGVCPMKLACYGVRKDLINK